MHTEEKTTIKRALEEKHKDISSVVPIGEHLTDLKFRINALNDLVESNNSLINDINWKKNSIGEENKNIRRNICKAAYNQWVEKYNKEQKQYVEYGKQI